MVQTRQVFHIKQGDRSPSLIAKLVDENGVVIDLTQASTVKLNMYEPNSGTLKINGAAVNILAPPSAGRVQYLWGVNDTDTQEDYDAEFEVTWVDGTETTFPNNGYFRVRVVKQLG